MHSVVRAANGFDKMACTGGVGVLVGSLKPTIDEPMMTKLNARFTERR